MEWRPLAWVGSSRRDLRAFPKEVRVVMGRALEAAQLGGRHPYARVLRGFGGAGVLEVVDDYDGSTYRAVYTVRFADAVYVLHAFQKKSKHGVETPHFEMEVVRARLARLRRDLKDR
ncbi:MAG TPA: type II toxin-antitoxin system RelE/ParE family toxin [Longimicrobium sp.]|nr:type II toxin-antitoxin system RelE/ParE family toxin [Longimicrobium sp.]